MKVHPIIPKKRNMTIRYDVAPLVSQKKLRRLPHIFEKVLQLPFRSNARVFIQETPRSLRFVVDITPDIISADIFTETIDICPGVTKIVVRGSSSFDDDLSDLELDAWRFRLPAATRPELASAAVVGGKLVVTVPKNDVEEMIWAGDASNGGLVLVH